MAQSACAHTHTYITERRFSSASVLLCQPPPQTGNLSFHSSSFGPLIPSFLLSRHPSILLFFSLIHSLTELFLFTFYCIFCPRLHHFKLYNSVKPQSFSQTLDYFSPSHLLRKTQSGLYTILCNSSMLGAIGEERLRKKTDVVALESQQLQNRQTT